MRSYSENGTRRRTKKFARGIYVLITDQDQVELAQMIRPRSRQLKAILENFGRVQHKWLLVHVRDGFSVFLGSRPFLLRCSRRRLAHHAVRVVRDWPIHVSFFMLLICKEKSKVKRDVLKTGLECFPTSSQGFSFFAELNRQDAVGKRGEGLSCRDRRGWLRRSRRIRFVCQRAERSAESHKSSEVTV